MVLCDLMAINSIVEFRNVGNVDQLTRKHMAELASLNLWVYMVCCRSTQTVTSVSVDSLTGQLAVPRRRKKSHLWKSY